MTNCKGNFVDDLKNFSNLSCSEAKSSEIRLIESKLSLNDELENEIKTFYTKNVLKDIKSVSFSCKTYDEQELLNEMENFEINYEKTFKAINKFARSQSAKLDKRSSTEENIKSRRRLEEYDFKNENKKLGKILESKHLKDQTMLKNVYSDSEESYG